MGKKSKQKKGKQNKKSGNQNPNKGHKNGNGGFLKALRESWFSVLVLSFAVFFYEMIFKVSVTDGTDGRAVIPILLFSLIYGLILYLLSSWSKNPKVNYAIKAVLLLLLCLPYGIEYFVFKQFKMLYDLPTIGISMDDVVGSRFMGHAIRIMTDADGIAHIILLISPFLVFLLKGRTMDTCKRISRRILGIVLCSIVFLTVINSAVISQEPKYHDAYGKQYNFPAAVENFGLMTGIRLDVLNLSGANDRGFQELEEIETAEEDNITITEGKPEGEEEEQVLIEYDYNVMDIDFDAIEEAKGNRLASINQYVKSLEPSRQNEMTGVFKGKNLIFLTAEAFSAEAIDPVITPTLYRLATKGINFTDYYQQATAGTTGGEYQNIFGLLPMRGGASFFDASRNYNYFTMGSQLDRLGYYGMAFHNNDYKYYSRHVTHNTIGYSEGYMGYGNGLEDGITLQWPESDLEMMEVTVDKYIDHQPFNIYYMTVSGHSPYGLSSNEMAKKNVARVETVEGSERIRSYKAANVELDRALEYLVKKLEEKHIEDDTVIVIAADHFPYGLDDDAGIGQMPYLEELYGFPVTNYFERDHNRLIIWCGELEKKDTIIVDDPTSSIDILPTLSNLFGLEWDSRLLVGRDVFSDADALVFDMAYDWKTSQGTYLSGLKTFIPNNPNMQTNWDGYVERINKVVSNKLQFCTEVLRNDYYRYLLEE